MGNNPSLSPIFSDEYGNYWMQALVSGIEGGYDKVALPIFTDWFIAGIPEVA